MRSEVSHEVLVNPFITPKYLCHLFLKQTASYTNSQLTYTYLVKSEFLKVMRSTKIEDAEETALNVWTAYVFGNEEQIPLSLVIVRCNSFLHI